MEIVDCYSGRDFSLPLLRLCCVNQFTIYDFHIPATDTVHPTGSFHRLDSFHIFRDTFRFCHLFYQPKKYFLCLPVNGDKTAIQSAAGEKCHTDCPPMLLQVAPIVLTPHAEGAAALLRAIPDQEEDNPQSVYKCRPLALFSRYSCPVPCNSDKTPPE